MMHAPIFKKAALALAAAGLMASVPAMPTPSPRSSTSTP